MRTSPPSLPSSLASRTRLLVSVRNLAEARDAFAGGADLIDIKEPRYGSLGRADVRVWRAIVAELRDRVPLSVALGELTDARTLSRTSRLCDVQYAKVGLAGARNLPDWRRRWQAVTRQLGPSIEPVAVLYADWQQADTPLPQDILRQAPSLGCRIALLDTHGKQRGNLFRVLSPYQLQTLVEQIRYRQLQLVLAGSITIDDLPRALAWNPDWIAVRGAVCVGGRRGRVSRELVQRLSSRLS